MGRGRASLLLDRNGDDLVFVLNLGHFNLFHHGLHHGDVHLSGGRRDV